MSSEMIVDAAQRQFAAAEETLVAWKPEDSELAALVSYAENAIVLFLDRPATMRRVLERLRKVAQSEQAQNLLQLWYEGSYLFDAALRPLAATRRVIAVLRQAGFVVEGVEKLEQTVRELEEMRDQFRKTYPAATNEEAQNDRLAIAKGEYQDADEAFAEIAGVDLDTWRKRVTKSQNGQQG